MVVGWASGVPSPPACGARHGEASARPWTWPPDHSGVRWQAPRPYLKTWPCGIEHFGDASRMSSFAANGWTSATAWEMASCACWKGLVDFIRPTGSPVVAEATESDGHGHLIPVVLAPPGEGVSGAESAWRGSRSGIVRWPGA